MSLSALTVERIAALRASFSEWAPRAAEPERMLARQPVEVVRAQLDEPASLSDLMLLAHEQAEDVPFNLLDVQRRQRPDPAGEGSIQSVALVQTRPMDDVEYEAYIEQLWQRLERSRLRAQGIDPQQLALYRQLHARYGHLQAAA